MQYSAASYRSGDGYAEEEKFFDNNIASVIDTDYILNYIDNSDPNQRRSLQVPNLYNQSSHDLQASFNNFQDSGDALQNLYGKFNLQESWALASSSETLKMHSNLPSATFSYKSDEVGELGEDIKTKKLKSNKETEVKKVVENPSKGKNNIKNTYINKINSLITEPKPPKRTKGSKAKLEDAAKEDLKRSAEVRDSVPISRPLDIKLGIKKVKSCDMLKSDELEKLNVKLAKNRESARNSRIRKKVYIELLEKTVDQLQQELVTTRKQLDTNNNTSTNTVSKVGLDVKPISNLSSGKQQLYDRLEKLVAAKADESEISFLIDSIRLRFGASGKDRVDAVNYMFKQIMEFLVPVHMKYVLHHAEQGNDLFNSADLHVNLANGEQLSPNNSVSWNRLASDINLSESQRKHLLKCRKKFQLEKQKFESLITNMNHIRKNAFKQANSLQILIDDLRNYMSPVQTALMICAAEKDKDNKEFSVNRLWATHSAKKDSDEFSQESDTFLDNADDEVSDDEGLTGMDFSQNLSAGTSTPSE